MSNLYRGPSIDASYQVSYHLAKWLQRKSYSFRNRPIRNKNCLWWPCLLMDQNGMSNSHRGPSIDAFYHVSVHLAKLLQSRRILFYSSLHRLWCVSFYSLIRFTLYCLTWSLRFLVSEFFCKRLFTIPNTCSITASCLKSSLPWNCGKKVAFTIKKNYMFTWSCIAHLVFYTQFKTTIKSSLEKNSFH